jgi:hypothetical protein
VKDAKGHGSEKHNGNAGVLERIMNPAPHNNGIVAALAGHVPVHPDAVRTIRDNALSGFSAHPVTGESPKVGYQVAVQGRTDPQPLDLKGDIKAQVDAHVARNKDVYTNPRMYVGGWVSNKTGKVHLEPSENVEGKFTAINKGVTRNQVEIWDNKNMKSVSTAGTGE